MAQQLKTGDQVQIISGDHKGKIAKIIKMNRAQNKAILENINVIERHFKRSRFNPQGGKKTIQLGIDLSNLKKVEGKK